MFHVGDKVVHPLHGAGVIEGMVERTIDDTPAWYYVLRPAFGDTELFLPVDGCGRLGIRPVCSRERAERFLDGLDAITCSESKSWNQRYRENMQHIRSATSVRLHRSSRACLCGTVRAVCPRVRKRCSNRPCRYWSLSLRLRSIVRRSVSQKCCVSICAAEPAAKRKALSGKRLCMRRVFFDFCKEK